MFLALCFFLGVASGLRTFTPPTAVSWAARAGVLHLTGTPLAFLAAPITPILLTVLAVAELIMDKLPKTSSRKVPPAFIARVFSGSFVGAAVGIQAHMVWIGLVVGALGAVVGTLGGAALRTTLARAFGKDLPAALLEDTAAIALAAIAITRI